MFEKRDPKKIVKVSNGDRFGFPRPAPKPTSANKKRGRKPKMEPKGGE